MKIHERLMALYEKMAWEQISYEDAKWEIFEIQNTACDDEITRRKICEGREECDFRMESGTKVSATD